MGKWLITLTCMAFLMQGQAFAQGSNGMLIYQIDGNRYLRKNYDAKGVMKNYQTIEVGKLSVSKGIIKAKMTVLSYDKNDNQLNDSQTTIRCNPAAQEVLMGIFPFADGKSNLSLKIEMPEGEGLYPAGWQQESTLPDFNFRLILEGGAGGFFGPQSRIVISQRKVSQQPDDTFRVSGEMTLKVYLARFRISTINYEYTEDIDPKKGIVKQVFKENKGAYFTIELMGR